ncbi:hypothetical protein ABZU75_23455 [Streptosporangium sp. NPDC005286]
MKRTTPWYEDNPATCQECGGAGSCEFCGGEGIVPRWVYEGER